MVKTKGHFAQTEEPICIAVRVCPLDSNSTNMTPFSFCYSAFTVYPLRVGGGRGVWSVGKCHCHSAAESLSPTSHLLSVVCVVMVPVAHAQPSHGLHDWQESCVCVRVCV